MVKQTAGLLVYRRRADGIEVLLGHPGGPFWAKKDLGTWSIPKGEYLDDEKPLAAALREFEEEIGIRVEGDFLELTPCRQPGGKIVHAWAVEYEIDTTRQRSNLFAMEWPPKSGKMQNFPEIDRAEWFSVAAARTRLVKGQLPILEEFVEKVR